MGTLRSYENSKEILGKLGVDFMETFRRKSIEKPFGVQ